MVLRAKLLAFSFLAALAAAGTATAAGEPASVLRSSAQRSSLPREVTPVPGVIQIELIKEARGFPSLCTGSPIYYTVTLINQSTAATGSAPAAILDVVPEHTVLLRDSVRGAEIDDGPPLRIVWNGTLAPGESHAVTFTVIVNLPPPMPDSLPVTEIVNVAEGSLAVPGVDPLEGEVTVPVPLECPPAPIPVPVPCELEIGGRVEDEVGNGGDRYPISDARVWLYDLKRDPLPIPPLSRNRGPDAVTATNFTDEAAFGPIDFPDPQVARYGFGGVLPVIPALGQTCPPRVAVVSFLWDARDLFAVSSEVPIGGRFVPLYLARCISPDPEEVGANGPCLLWEQLGPNRYRARPVDYTFGADPQSPDSARVVGDPAFPASSEEWDSRGVGFDTFQREGSHIYFYTYKAMEYLVEQAERVGVPLRPVVVALRSGRCAACTLPRNEYPDFLPRFGLPFRESEDPDAIILIGDEDDRSSVLDGGKPDNREWHEMGHYWMIELYGTAAWPGGFLNDGPPCDELPRVPVPPTLASSGKHCGYANESTTDSFIEGFAEFTSMLTAEYYEDDDPHLYRIESAFTNLEIDYRVWGPVVAQGGGSGDLTAFRSLDGSSEDFAVAGILWDLHDKNLVERKPRGTLSNVVQTEDRMGLDEELIFDLVRNRDPETLAQLHDELLDRFPQNSDAAETGDTVADVSEIFLAHAAFDDVAPRNLKHDAGEEPGATGSRVLPARPERDARPAIPSAYLRARFVDGGGAAIDPSEVILEVRIRVDPPHADYSYEFETRPASELVYLPLPPGYFPSVAEIRAVWPAGGKVSARFRLNSATFWQRIGEGAEVVAEPVFVLDREPGCVAGPTTLCLSQGRFAVEVEWTAPQGTSGRGRAEPLTDETGTFWFFDRQNLELVVKVLDACSFTRRFWVFAGGLTNVAVTLTVTDTESGESKIYRNPQRTPFQPIQDTAAFATCPAGGAPVTAGPAGLEALSKRAIAGLPGLPRDLAPAPAAAGPSPGAPEIFLAGGRFRVEARWATDQGTRGQGHGVALTGDTGTFWFFDAANVEVVIKVLDACSFSGRFWVFAAGLTDVAVQIEVTDTESGESKTYRNPQRTPFQPIQDTSAFATCP